MILAAGLIALSRTVKASCERQGEQPVSQHSFSVSNSINLRHYFKTYVPKHGNLTGHFEQNFYVPPDIDDVSEFWKVAHDLNLKLQVNLFAFNIQTQDEHKREYKNWQATKSKSPLDLLKNQPVHCRMGSVRSQMSVACYNILDRIFPTGHTQEQENLMIEDVFHCQVEM